MNHNLRRLASAVHNELANLSDDNRETIATERLLGRGNGGRLGETRIHCR